MNEALLSSGDRKEEASSALAPLQELSSVVADDGLTLEKYTNLVGAAQRYYDDYMPPDEAGRRVRAHLKEALAEFRIVMDGWSVETIAGPGIAAPEAATVNRAEMWKCAVEDVGQAEDDAGL